nr:uncharacterized protein LOC126537842 [Dermacentor andersoni]
MKSILLSLAYLASSVFPNAVVGQSATSLPADPVAGENKGKQIGNEIPQDAPVSQKGGGASGEPTSTNEIPTTPVEKGGSPKVPEPAQPLWESDKCTFLGHKCFPLDYCKPKYRLRLHGCKDSDVCCNVYKTRSCTKIGGECRKKCHEDEEPNRYVRCGRSSKNCCVSTK